MLLIPFHYQSRTNFESLFSYFVIFEGYFCFVFFPLIYQAHLILFTVVRRWVSLHRNNWYSYDKLLTMNPDFNQPFYDPSVMNMPPNFISRPQLFIPPPTNVKPRRTQKPKTPFLSGVPSLHLPAILLFLFTWIIHAIATFIPYWSIYPNIADARAGQLMFCS